MTENVNLATSDDARSSGQKNKSTLAAAFAALVMLFSAIAILAATPGADAAPSKCYTNGHPTKSQAQAEFEQLCGRKFSASRGDRCWDWYPSYYSDEKVYFCSGTGTKHTAWTAATHMQLKDSNGKTVCSIHYTKADRKPVVYNCPTGTWTEQLFDANWKQIGWNRRVTVR